MQLEIDFVKSSTNSAIDGLNEKQLEVVVHKDGPLLIIAGAGTGKTTVISRRIAHILEQGWAKPSETLALTFTEKAAAEMEERVDQLVPYGYTDMWISTFHSFGERLLRDYAIEIGLPSHYKLLTGTEQVIFMNENIFAFDLKHYRPLGNPTSHIEALLNHFSRLKDELVTPEEYLALVENKELRIKNKGATDQENENCQELEKLRELANAYAKYNELMLESGNLDFGDLIFLTYKLLKDNPKILAECQNQFKYILVDEYQDTNYAQNEIVKLIASKHQNITVVGDDDQSIYRFRGASISNILDFNETYPGARQIVLTNNYRSTQEILDASYSLIQHNNPDRLEVKNSIDKRLKAVKNGPAPELIHTNTLSNEADSVVEKIKEFQGENDYSFKDFAILVRANSQAEPFMQSLNMAGIPFVFSGASNLYDRAEIKVLIAFLKCLVNPNDHLSFYTLATSDLYGIPVQLLSEYYYQARRSNRSVPAIVEEHLQGLIEPDEQLTRLTKDIRTYQDKMKSLNAGELLYEYLTEKEHLKKLAANPSVENEIKIKNIAKFFDRIANFQHSAKEKSALGFIENMELILDAGDETAVSDIDPELDAVNILTAHASKGLEWKIVFIANVTSDRFPSRKRRDPLPIPDELIRERLPEGDFHLEEERRLFYVAATRAKERLFLTFAEDCGGKRKKKLSQFAVELLGNSDIKQTAAKPSIEEKIDRFKKLDIPAMKLPYKFSTDKIKLSRLQVDDYYTCPRKFYFSHIVRIPLLENHSLMYGTAIHAAINHHLSRRMKGEQVGLELLLNDFKAAFHGVGFLSIDHEKKRFKDGIETLTRFFADNTAETAVPSAQEQNFEFVLGDALIHGRYDAIYGTGESVEIRDFKTSDVKTQEDANRRIKESTQMALYALSWYEQYKVVPKTTLYFIESGLRGSITYDIEKINETKQMISEVIGGIKSNEMTAKPDIFSCRWCPFKSICPNSIAK